MGNGPSSNRSNRRRSLPGSGTSYLVYGKAPASILHAYQGDRAKQTRKKISVTVTAKSISIQGTSLPQLNCLPPDASDGTSIRIFYEEDGVDEVKMTQFSETTCMLTMTIKGTDVYFIPLRDCSFDSTVKGRKFHHNFRKRVPCRAIQVYYREAKVECPTCRTVHKMSEIVEEVGQRGGAGLTRGGGCGGGCGGGEGGEGGEGGGLDGALVSPGRDCVVCLHATPTMRFRKCGHLCTCKPCLSLYLESKNITLNRNTRKRFASGAGTYGGPFAVGLGERMDGAYTDDKYDEEKVARDNDTWMDFTNDILDAATTRPPAAAAAK